MSEPALSTQLQHLLADLQKANERLARADQAYGEANRERCSALNAANALQQEFDKLVAKVRTTAPQDTDWRRLARQGRAAEVSEG